MEQPTEAEKYPVLIYLVPDYVLHRQEVLYAFHILNADLNEFGGSIEFLIAWRVCTFGLQC